MLPSESQVNLLVVSKQLESRKESSILTQTTTTNHSHTAASCFNSKLQSSNQHFFSLKSCFTALSHRWTRTLLPDHMSSSSGNRSGQHKRQQLEKEVSTLHNILIDEDKMHGVLDRILHRRHGSVISIPNFLPRKMKELLAELAMVEDEISRLESQISELKLGLKHEQEINKETKSSNTAAKQVLSNGSEGHEKMKFDTTSLHFISKAINGGDYYNVNCGFALTQKVNSSSLFDDHDRATNTLIETMSLPSLKREPKSEEKIQKWQPNKLSESIIKCLNFIYVRLLRTSRAVELETISRSMNSSFASRSFRIENGSKANVVLHKEAMQKDPCGIFKFDELTIPRDIGPYKKLVIFTSSSMDPKYISSSGSIQLLKKLRFLISNLQNADLKFSTYQQKLAFWINMYNACIMHGFLLHGVPSTPETLLNLINKSTLNIGGKVISAQAIEQHILRKPTSFDMKDDFNGLQSIQQNVTFALCCGTRSSPAVRVYTAECVIAELERSKLEYLQASVVVTNTKRIAFPEILFKNMLQFALEGDSLADWVCQQLPTSGSLRKSIVDCYRSVKNGKLHSPIEKIPYDFEFQYILAISM